MDQPAITPVCTYYEKGFCKFKVECGSYHSKTVCQKSVCRDKACRNRHPKNCKYGDQCRRRSRCLYCHSNKSDKEQKSVAKEYNDLKKEVEKLKDDIIILKTNNDITMNNLVKAQLTGLKHQFSSYC